MKTKKESREHLPFNYSALIFAKQFYEYFACNQQTLSWSLDFSHLSFFLSSCLHQYSEELLKTHMGIDFRPEPCGLNSRRACQKSQREGRAKERRKARKKNRKKDGTFPKEHLTKTRCWPDPHYLRHVKNRKGKRCWNNKTRRRQNNKRREAAIISPLCGCLFYIFNKEINAHFKCVRWATICRHALMCLLQPPLKFCTSSRNKGNKIRG